MEILYDVDGVIIGQRKKLFTQALIDDLGVPTEELAPFLDQVFFPAFVGKKDLRFELPKYLSKWGIQKSVDDIFEFWWSLEGKIRPEVLAVIDEARSLGARSFLASDQEINRGEHILDQLKGHIDGGFMSYVLGEQKKSRGFWLKVREHLGDGPILYWDDGQSNVDVASEFVDARLYQGLDDFRKQTMDFASKKSL